MQRLKNDYKSAQIFEKECAKNIDELERVELSLAKAKSEFDISQKMCDLHDDVLRLNRFDELATIKTQLELLEKESEELDKSVNFDVTKASHEAVASIKNAATLFAESRGSLESANADFEQTKMAAWLLP